MKPFIAVNDDKIALDTELKTFELVKTEVTRYLHTELLRQFKVQTPAIFLVQNTGEMAITIDNELESLNSINVNYLQKANILAPKNLLIYYLVNQLLNIRFEIGDISVKNGKKKQFVFHSRSFDLDFYKHAIIPNLDLLKMIRKFIPESEILNIASTYSIRMNEGMKRKMATSLTYYKTMLKVNNVETDIVNNIFDTQRIQQQTELLLK